MKQQILLPADAVYAQNVELPLRSIPVITRLSRREQYEGPVFLAMEGTASPSRVQTLAMADLLAESELEPLYLCIRQEMANVLGQALTLRLGEDARILCIDGVQAGEGSFLNVGKAIDGAYPLTIVTD